VKLQVLLDRAGASPGVIDGFDGDNVRKAVRAFELMHGLPQDGAVDEDVVAALDRAGPVVGGYVITAEDVAAIGEPIPDDYAEMAQREFLGYASVVELLGERFHMDADLLRDLNPGAQFVAGETIAVTAYGPDVTDRKVARIEADKTARQVRAYDAEGELVVAYPATIGSEDNPSPSGTHLVDAIAPMPNYTYNPDVNFQQGENTEKLIIPPGPNGPVGAMWIDLTEPTFGIHGTPEPSKIDKTASHGCVRLTNWDATELAGLVEKGVPLEFVGYRSTTRRRRHHRNRRRSRRRHRRHWRSPSRSWCLVGRRSWRRSYWCRWRRWTARSRRSSRRSTTTSRGTSRGSRSRLSRRRRRCA
jgi:lipoprotein-anchoring transpeptidase ErfK/SrfK